MRDRLGQRPGPQRGQLTGPNPTDRGKKGSKIHLIVDRQGLPLSIGISAANLHDSQHSSRWSAASHPSAHVAARDADGPPSYTATRDTTAATCGDGSLPAASCTALPAGASSGPGGWAGTAGWWSGPCPGCPTAAACTAATSASRNTSLPSPPSPRPSYVTADWPNEMTSKCARASWCSLFLAGSGPSRCCTPLRTWPSRRNGRFPRDRTV